MKVTKEVRNSNDYDDNGELKGQYIYITYNEEKNKVLEITIQKNRDDYAVYFDIPIQLNLNLDYKQSSLIEMNNYFLSNLSEVDKVIEKCLNLLSKFPDKKIAKIAKAVCVCGVDYRIERRSVNFYRFFIKNKNKRGKYGKE